jgi:hypothetical protein
MSEKLRTGDARDVTYSPRSAMSTRLRFQQFPQLLQSPMTTVWRLRRLVYERHFAFR